jgi:hypothetical protein
MPSENTERASFWLFADNSFDLAMDFRRIGSFVAYMKHSLLFHERLLLSDSLAVNTPNFRRAIQQDRLLREYMAEGAVVIAQRKEEGKIVDLTELRNQLGNSMNQGFHSDRSVFDASDDLIELQNAAASRLYTYELSEISGYYTEKVKALTTDQLFLDKLGGDAHRVCQIINRQIEEHGSIDQTFLERQDPGNPDRLSTQLGNEIWQRVWRTIFEFERPYHGFQCDRSQSLAFWISLRLPGELKPN